MLDTEKQELSTESHRNFKPPFYFHKKKKKSLLDILAQQLQEKTMLSLYSSINDKTNTPSFCQN